MSETERYRPSPVEEPKGQSDDKTPEYKTMPRPEQDIPAEIVERQEPSQTGEVGSEQETTEVAGGRERSEYTPKEITEALRRHFEKMEAYSTEQKLDKLLKALMEKLDKQQQEKVKALLKEKARELQEKTKQLKTTLGGLIIIVKAILEILDENRK